MAKQQTPTIETDDDPTYAPRDGWEAPEGSAERVREDDDPVGETPADYAEDMHEQQADGSAFVTDYGPNGEPIDAPVEPGQQELFPDLPKPDPLWPDFDGKRVSKIRLAFAGECDLLEGEADRVLASQTARIGNEVTVTITGTVTGRSHKQAPKSPREVHGVCTLAVDEVSLGDAWADGIADHDEIEEAREEAAKYAEVVEDWVLWARDLLDDGQITEMPEALLLLKEMSEYKLPREQEPEGSDSAASDEAAKPEPAASALDEALAEALS